MGIRKPNRPGRSRGFTLIELMVAMVIIAIVAAIAIPALLNAIDRGRQKRTMADLRTIGAAIAAYSVDNNRYPAGSSVNDLVGSLEGDYIRKLPRRDGWGFSLVFSASGSLDYTLGSAGKDGGSTLSLNGTGGPSHSFDDDIIFVNGIFVQWPEGMQAD